MKKLKNQEDESLLGSLSADQAKLSQVDSIVNDFENKGVDKDNREREEDLQKGSKRVRVKGGTPEDQKRNSQIARLSILGGRASSLPQ